MKHSRNERINQLTEETLVIGVDIAKTTHYACPIDHRGRELERPIGFKQSREGFEHFQSHMESWLTTHGKQNALIAFEPTGHYWMNLATFLLDLDIPFVVVNPMHVKHSKEFDDNSQTKNDQKDARVIAKLASAGNFRYHKLPEGVEADLRNGTALRWQLKEETTRLKNKMIRWIDRYFPEYQTVIKGFGQLSCAVLKHRPLPADLAGEDIEDLVRVCKEAGVQAPAKPRLKALQQLAENSIGVTHGTEMARFEISSLIDQFLHVNHQLTELNRRLETLVVQLEEYEYLVSVPGIGKHTVIDLLAETGSLKQYDHPRQLLKLAGLTLRENSSGKHRGQKKISKRGRKRLRALLYRAILPLLHNNRVFQELYQYYITRPVNPLKKKEAMVVLCGKLLKIFFGLSSHNVPFNEERMKQDLHCLKAA